MDEAVKQATVSLMLGGDAMLGRLVGQHIRLYGADYPLGEVAELMRRADLTFVNLECAITLSGQQWSGAPKAFYFRAPPEAGESLLDAGVDGVILANNHSLDFDVAGLRDTLSILRNHGIGYTGAGENTDEALAPLFFERNGIRFGMVAFCDHQPDFAAAEKRPGVAYLDLTDDAKARAQFRQSLELIKQGNADWPILSLHWGPNSVSRPSRQFIGVAHAAIEMGYRILFGHSAHVFHGVEIYRGCPILYCAGDLVDDYYVDRDFGNDHQLLFELELTRSALRRIELHPMFIEDCRATLAAGSRFETIASRITGLCAEMGTTVEHADGRLWIACSP